MIKSGEYERNSSNFNNKNADDLSSEYLAQLCQTAENDPVYEMHEQERKSIWALRYYDYVQIYIYLFFLTNGCINLTIFLQVAFSNKSAHVITKVVIVRRLEREAGSYRRCRPRQPLAAPFTSSRFRIIRLRLR